MQRQWLGVLAAACCALCAPAFAEGGASSATTGTATSAAPAAQPAASNAQPAPSPDANKVVCKREESTGSNMATHVCHTKAEWAAIAERNDRETHDAYRQTRLIAPH